MLTLPRRKILDHCCPRHKDEKTTMIFFNTEMPSIIWLFSCGEQVSVEPHSVKLTLCTRRSERTGIFKYAVNFSTYIEKLERDVPHDCLPLHNHGYTVYTKDKTLVTDSAEDAVDFMLARITHRPSDLSVGQVEELLNSYTVEDILPKP